MSGFRRHLMMQAAQRQYIEGYAVQVGGVYPATINVRINNTYITIDVNQSTGYWVWSGTITSLRQSFWESAEIEKIKVYSRNQASVSMFQFARRSQTVKEIDCQGLETNNLNFAFGLTANDYTNGYRSSLDSIYLPIIRNNTLDSNNCLRYTKVLTDVRADYIEASLNMMESPLTLQSAINILNALQDVTSYGGATLTFSETTSALVQADTTAMNLVAQAQLKGWTITGF